MTALQRVLYSIECIMAMCMYCSSQKGGVDVLTLTLIKTFGNCLCCNDLIVLR